LIALLRCIHLLTSPIEVDVDVTLYRATKAKEQKEAAKEAKIKKRDDDDSGEAAATGTGTSTGVAKKAVDPATKAAERAERARVKEENRRRMAAASLAIKAQRGIKEAATEKKKAIIDAKR
jgi:hypothetical protein